MLRTAWRAHFELGEQAPSRLGILRREPRCSVLRLPDPPQPVDVRASRGAEEALHSPSALVYERAAPPGRVIPVVDLFIIEPVVRKKQMELGQGAVPVDHMLFHIGIP